MIYPLEWCIDQIKKLWAYLGPSPSDTYVHRAGGDPGGIMTGSLTLSGDPVNPLEAATKQYVDTVQAADKVTIVFVSPTNPWNLPHERGRYPTSVRLLVKFPTSSELVQIGGKVTDVTNNLTRVDFSASYAGQAELDF